MNVRMFQGRSIHVSRPDRSCAVSVDGVCAMPVTCTHSRQKMKRRTSFKKLKDFTVIPEEFWAHKQSHAGGAHAVLRWTALCGQLAAGCGVHGVGVRHPGLAAVTVAVMVAAQAKRALLAGAVAEGLAQLPAGAQFGHAHAGVHQGAGHAAALRGAGGCAQQHALASAHHGPNFILGDFK